jgi:hypothetical protein
MAVRDLGSLRVPRFPEHYGSAVVFGILPNATVVQQCSGFSCAQDPRSKELAPGGSASASRLEIDQAHVLELLDPPVQAVLIDSQA